MSCAKMFPNEVLASEEGNKTRRCRRVTYSESYIIECTMHSKIKRPVSEAVQLRTVKTEQVMKIKDGVLPRLVLIRVTHHTTR